MPNDTVVWHAGDWALALRGSQSSETSDISKLRTWSSPFSPWPAEFILNLERPRWLGNEELIVYKITARMS